MIAPPYSSLRAAERRAVQKHPDATRVHAVWTPAGEHDVVVEVWHGDRAKVVVV